MESDQKLLLIKILHECGLQVHNHTKPLYKYLSVDSAKAVLTNCTLKYSSPLKFNDPYEFNSNLVDFTGTKSEIKNYYYRLLTDYTWHGKVLSKSEKKTILNILLRDYSLGSLIETVKMAFDIGKQDSLVLCLSEINNNTLMWSHYADKHSGICLGIRMPEMNNLWDILTLKILYSDKFEKYKYLSQNENEKRKAYLRYIYTKSSHWSYEKEVRVYFQNDINAHVPWEPRKKLLPVKDLSSFIEIQPEQFCEIYYGLATKQTDIDSIETILREKEYKLDGKFKMVMNSNSFELGIKHV